MAVGDLKGENHIIKTLTAGAAVAKGQVVHLEADGKWDPCAADDVGPFAVAIEAAAADTNTFDAVIYGKVEVKATAAAIGLCAYVEAGATGLVAAAAHGAVGEIVGQAMEAFASGGTQTIFVGLGN